MAKTEITIELERNIWNATIRQGVFGCFEVTIGWFGRERVDYMTYDTKGTWRCYEIKVSKADFHSKAHNTFIGHYNYYVMPYELYQEIKDEIPPHIGVYCNCCSYCTNKAKKQELAVDEQILKDSMIRSLCREAGKQMASRNPTKIEVMKKAREKAESEARRYRKAYSDLQWEVLQRYGHHWEKVEKKYYQYGGP